MLAATEAIGRVPDVFVQATGTGIAALGAYEAALRLVTDGRFGRNMPQLLLAQNAPSAAVVDAWQTLSPRLKDDVPSTRATRFTTLRAPLLDVRPESYAIHGGLFDAMISSGARAYGVANPEIAAAQALFADTERIDIEAEAATAVAALWRAVRAGDIKPTDVVVLHISGGGRAAFKPPTAQMKPTFAVRVGSAMDEVRDAILNFFGRRHAELIC